MFAWHDTPWMWVSMIAFWSLFAVFGYHMLSGWTSRPSGRETRQPLEILKARYARGEITADEYRERCATLEAPGGPPSTP